MPEQNRPWSIGDASRGLLNLSQFARREGVTRYAAETAIVEGRVPGAFRTATGYKIPEGAKIEERAE